MTRLLIGGYQGDASVHTRAMQDFIAQLQGLSRHTITAEFRKNITDDGHAAADLLSMVGSGALDLCYFSSSYLTSQIRSLSAFEMPFSSSDRTDFYQLLDGSEGQLAKQDAASQSPFVILALWDNGVRHISNGKRELRSPKDCEGLSIRTLDNEFHQTVFRALGFNPRAIDVRDLAREVKEGTIDAQENPLTNLVNFDLHEHHRFVTLTAHFFGVALLLCNRSVYETWSVEMREAVAGAADAATSTQRSYAAAEEARCLSTLQSTGVLVSTLSADERLAFKDRVADLRA
jgi:TRAP-type C4-dicarboxylate transport system substrate-binding protein